MSLLLIGVLLLCAHLVSAGDNQEDANKNHAVDGIAAQSSTFGGFKANLAVDGKTDGCIATNKEKDPWWMVTFNKMILFFEVVIVNAANGGYLTNLDVIIGPSVNGEFKKCGWTSSVVSPGERKSFYCPSRTMGPILKITLPGEHNLRLCEVYAYGKVLGKNVATNGKAAQSSNMFGQTAEKALDGNADGVFRHGTCAWTNSDIDSWWMVTWKYIVRVYAVVVATSLDCCGGPERTLEVTVGPMQREFIRCGLASTNIMLGETKSFKCPINTEGQILRIAIRGNQPEFLVLCEVMVYGVETPKENLALLGIASMSSFMTMEMVQLPIDGNIDGIFKHGSCAMTMRQKDPWWEVRFTREITVNTVIIVNRAYVRGDMKKQVRVQLLPLPTTPNICSLTSTDITSGTMDTFTCSNKTKAAAVHIDKKGDDMRITLCEVLVYGEKWKE